MKFPIVRNWQDHLKLISFCLAKMKFSNTAPSPVRHLQANLVTLTPPSGLISKVMFLAFHIIQKIALNHFQRHSCKKCCSTKEITYNSLTKATFNSQQNPSYTTNINCCSIFWCRWLIPLPPGSYPSPGCIPTHSYSWRWPNFDHQENMNVDNN